MLPLQADCSVTQPYFGLFATPWIAARQAPLSMGFSGEEYWSGLPFPPPGNLPDSGVEPESPASPALGGGFFTTEPPGKPTVGGIGSISGRELRTHLPNHTATKEKTNTHIHTCIQETTARYPTFKTLGHLTENSRFLLRQKKKSDLASSHSSTW